MSANEMQLVAFAWSRFPDPYAIVLGGAVGFLSRAWWQTVLAGFVGGIALALAFGLIGGMSHDAPVYFLMDAIVAVSWSSAVFYFRGVLRERRRLRQSG